jgi:hypothetical protein
LMYEVLVYEIVAVGADQPLVGVDVQAQQRQPPRTGTFVI